MGAGALIALALCVFLWGLEYKLSLYDHPQSFARLVPIAKLLSKNEQPQIASSTSVAAPAGPTSAPRLCVPMDSLLLLAILPVLSLPAIRAWRLRLHPKWVPQVSPQKTFFVRSPPIRM